MNPPKYATMFTPAAGISFSARPAQLAKLSTTNGGTKFYKPILVGSLADVAELVEKLNELPAVTIENTP